ncbi:hypothetical protein [Rhizobium ruizarguesonis]|uniref:hypothetical protein n=1 Tax=Rhizobium ruizarguesonis TaxID=2081791 RepID=UPI0010321764|nr:hypothetical protein [Rhizobium ruizarguesonis]TBD71602.1 hypothetical protein ELH11_38545 [Rhizobium ruizarguesonis]TBD94844.1 hypothetical protein ELH09_38265 [Rhizobium ruizarguesonis]TBE14538.1 hypothetical protein ELH07_38365 [Rhizobium ruizarguesonis]TBE14706.1 hypothetical protein ELH08_38930 [Rhizobium ruizarguesonis]WSH04974.1 hypothetical protein U8P71_34690 [Rhizobium ruizarguesonis]
MDPISAIVGALIAGATAAMSDVASKGIVDAYEGLKSLIATRFKRKAALEMVEEAPESKAAHDALANALKEVGADRDPEVNELAKALATALQQMSSEDLSRANIKIGDVLAYRDAIVREVVATGDVEVGNVTGQTGDAIVSGIKAGNPTGKK